ncbi:MAG: tyrosine-type recombinase/integrase [Bacillota bacterium]
MPMYVAPFLAFLSSEKRPPGYRERRGYYLRVFTQWCEATDKDPLTDINGADLIRYRGDLLDARHHSYVREAMRTLLEFYDWAVAARLISANPARQVERDLLAVPTLNGEQQQAVLKAAADDPLTLATVILLLRTGLRLSEMCELNLQDVDLDDVSPRLTVRRGKTGSRVVPLSKTVRATLRGYLRQRPSAEHHGFFLLGSPPRRLRPGDVHLIVSRIGARVGLKRLTAHLLRLTCLNVQPQQPPVERRNP